MALPHWPFVATPHSNIWKNKDKRLEEDYGLFKDMVEYMDYAVGRIIDHVDAQGLGEDTVIIFYSDNGTHLKVTSDTTSAKLPVKAGRQMPVLESLL